MADDTTTLSVAAPATGAAAPRRLTRGDREPAAQALARAFWDDPLTNYWWPGDNHRRTMLPILMRGGIQLAGPHEECFTAEESPVGGALFLPPGRSKLPMTSVFRVMAPNIWRWRPAELFRFISTLDEFEKKHDAQLEAPHWYLMLLGVDPPRQGQGLGGTLMSDVLKRADIAGQDVYLETQKARNVPFYRKHGFEVVENFRCHGGRGPETWTMLRHPQRA
jgi:GNAT superfamily N-acetyltransferase